jgi:spermidine synthase
MAWFYEHYRDMVMLTEPIGPAAPLFGEAFFRDLAAALRPGGGGGWLFLLASDERTPQHVDLERAAALDSRYYSPAIAAGAFALPAFIANSLHAS